MEVMTLVQNNNMESVTLSLENYLKLYNGNKEVRQDLDQSMKLLILFIKHLDTNGVLDFYRMDEIFTHMGFEIYYETSSGMMFRIGKGPTKINLDLRKK